ncbi:MAG: PfkB family carbohydrate kinase [Planctomycetia bacterium]|nr:PfkB family carbohydrate kinase [Planctomycetia bacterium]
MTVEITGIGANVYDTLVKLPAFPVEDTKCVVNAVAASGGGPCGTGLVAAAKLGAKVSLLAVLSNDAGGTFLLDDYHRYGVDTRLVTRCDGESFSATVLLNEATGSRTCLLNRGTLPALELSEAQKQEIASAKVLLLDGNEMAAAMEGAKVARSAGVKVLYDAGGLYPQVSALLPLVDLLIPSAEFAMGHTGTTNIEDAARVLMEQYHPEIVVVTDGARGGLLDDGKKQTRYPAFPVTVADSNGAGDVFHGAFAFAVTCGWDYAKCAVFSSAVSALKCTQLGARPGVPTYPQTMQFLEERNYVL